MTRLILGPRANGDNGLFVPPLGVDAYTAGDDALLLTINRKVPQLIMLGFVDTSQVVALGFSQPPYVFLTGLAAITSGGYSGITGPARPSIGFFSSIGATYFSPTATINGNGASMSLNVSFRTRYEVYNSAYA